MAKKDEKKNKVKKNEIVVPNHKYVVVYVLLVIGIIISVVLAQYFTTKRVDDIVLSQLNYFETANIDYRVYYIENEFYKNEFYNEGPYITQYIDKIVANYNYYTSYSNNLNGYYDYKIVATLKVFEPGNENNVYWSPTYNLTDEETVDFNRDSSYRILKEVEIDFNKYLNEYNNYKSQSYLPTDAKLLVEFIIENGGEYTGLDSINHSASMLLEIPLNDASFTINTVNSVKPEEQKIIKYEDNQAERIFVMIIAGLCWVFAIFLIAVLLIIYRTNLSKESLYSRKLRRILNTYDSIIVNVEKLPKLSDYSVVNVTTFEELVDAQMEVRLPINFKEDTKKHEAKFVLVRNNLAWVYTLVEGKEDEK